MDTLSSWPVFVKPPQSPVMFFRFAPTKKENQLFAMFVLGKARELLAFMLSPSLSFSRDAMRKALGYRLLAKGVPLG